jgi:hypothetical protein
MKQELITISSAVAVGALSRGLTGTMTETSSNTVKGVVNGVVAFGAGFLAVKVKGSDSKSSLMRGSAIGVSIAHGLEVVKNIFSSEKIASKLSSETAIGRFMQKAVGLSGAVNGLNGYIDGYGNYHEDGLGGYIDVNGNYVEDGLGGYNEQDGLNGYYDEAGNYIEDGLGAYDDEDGLGAYEDEDGLGAYIDENGNYIL